MRLRAIAFNTFKEAIRDKVFYNLLIFALLVIYASVLLGNLSIGENEKIVKDVSLAAMSVFGTLIAILVGISLVYKEIERRTIHTILSKPVSRYEFLLSKYFGLILTLTVNLVVMTLFFALVVQYLHYDFSFLLLKAILLIFWELLLITAIALLFSTFSSPTLSAVFTFAIYLIGHLADDLKQIGSAAKSELIKQITAVCYYLLPNLSNFNIRAEMVRDIPVSNWYVLSAIAYGTLYTAVIIILSIISFHRREFN
jgi:ABC-type transport system involved in multi-copper enzyme maturation permease subunit